MNRSIWKIPRIIREKRQPSTAVTNTYLRSAVIGPAAIDQTVNVHNGHKFIRVLITEHFVGYKYGSFAQTKKKVFHKRKKKK